MSCVYHKYSTVPQRARKLLHPIIIPPAKIQTQSSEEAWSPSRKDEDANWPHNEHGSMFSSTNPAMRVKFHVGYHSIKVLTWTLNRQFIKMKQETSMLYSGTSGL
ncbi:hypothetical protein VTL71DRAFT_752 [Oculimacula yallundae]|uniref:Uncharacterized protein n=1 Tax=Oculimacula yallundae TaxID=86028 RepID=A0ABR4D113_9HELO